MLETYLLVVARADELGCGLPRDRDDRRVVELGVVQPVQEMHCARTCRAHARGQAPGQLRLRRGHERAGFLVAHQHKAHVVATAQGVCEVVDRIAGHTEDVAHAMGGKNVENHICGSHRGLRRIQPVKTNNYALSAGAANVTSLFDLAAERVWRCVSRSNIAVSVSLTNAYLNPRKH